MSIFEKFKKKVFKTKIESINQINNKRIKQHNLKNIVEDTAKLLREVITDQPNLITQTKTLQRLDELELFMTWATTTILDVQAALSSLENKHDTEIAELRALLNKYMTVADFVLDTTDRQYKDVKEILINHAVKSNTILYQGTYQTLDDILNNWTTPTPTEVEYAKRAGVANKVVFNQAVDSLDNIMLNYISDRQWNDILNTATQNGDTYQAFKTALTNHLMITRR